MTILGILAFLIAGTAAGGSRVSLWESIGIVFGCGAVLKRAHAALQEAGR